MLYTTFKLTLQIDLFQVRCSVPSVGQRSLQTLFSVQESSLTRTVVCCVGLQALRSAVLLYSPLLTSCWFTLSMTSNLLCFLISINYH